MKIKRIGIRLPEHMWEKIKKIAEYEGLTLNALIITKLKELIEEWENKNKKEC